MQQGDVTVSNVVIPFTYDVIVNAAPHQYTSIGGDTATIIRDNLVTQINGGLEPVQAFAVGTDRLVVFPDVPTATHTYSVSANLMLVVVFGGTNLPSIQEVGVEISSTPPPSPTIHLAVLDAPITLSPPLPPGIEVFAFDSTDTIRGGKEIVISAPTLAIVDAGEDERFQGLSAAPAGWTEIGGGNKNYEFAFTELESTATAGTFSGLQHDSVLQHFDAAIDLEPVNPQAVRGTVDVAIFRFDVASIAIPASLIIQVERGSDKVLLVKCRMNAFGRTIVGHVVGIDPNRFTLRIVRNAGRIHAFIGTRGSDRVYTSLTSLFATDQFVTEGGNLSIRVDNRDRAINVKSRVTNFTLESHARIGPRLLENKVIKFGRIVGAVPAGTLEELGSIELAVFGLFGESLSPEGFEYTLPVPRTVGRERTRLLELFSDRQIRDGDS